MSKTGWTMTVSAALVVGAVALGLTRRAVLGPDIDGPRGKGVWLVTVEVTGQLGPDAETLTTPLPPDFRSQHISQQHFNSNELIPRLGKRKQTRRRAVTWRRASVVAGERQPYQLSYSFHCLIGARRPTASMNRVTQLLDAAPTSRRYLRAAPLIESNDPMVREQGRESLRDLDGAAREERARALFAFVDGLDSRDDPKESQGARECLQARAGDSAGKARLLVALCRGQGIHARLVTGIVLAGVKGDVPLHYWAEAWVGGHWLPMCPTFHHFGPEQFPDNYLVFRTTDQGITARGDDKARFTFQVQNLRGVDTSGRPPEASPLRTFFLRSSLYRLRPGEQHLVRFLLLLPLAALIVGIYRTLIGVPTFGTFSPALLGLAFLDLRALRWGLPIFLLIILAGWAMRHGLERFHLLQVPRAAALLMLIVVASNYGVSGTQYVGLFPLVILTHLVERFWTIEAEDGTFSSFKTLLGTVVVSITVSVVLSPEVVPSWMLRYPETLIVVLAAHLALGRYTGYRLSELYRFGDMIEGEPGDDLAIVKTTGESLVIPASAEKPSGKLQAGGYDAASHTLHLGHAAKGHPRNVSATGGDTGSPGLAGITVFICDDGRVFWANDSLSLPRCLTPEEALTVQRAIEREYPNRPVVRLVRIGDVPK